MTNNFGIKEKVTWPLFISKLTLVFIESLGYNLMRKVTKFAKGKYKRGKFYCHIHFIDD